MKLRSGSPLQPHHWRRISWLLIAWSLLLMGYNSIQNPLFESPDEVEHLGYILHLRQTGSLPIQELDEPPSQSHQPPLYYFLGSLLTRRIAPSFSEPERNPFWTSYYRDRVHQDNKNQFLPSSENSFPYEGTALLLHLLRIYSIGLAAATLLVGRAIGQTLWPNRPELTALLLATAGLNPMFVYISSSLNNDNLVNLLGALMLLLCLRAFKGGFSWPDTLLIALCWGGALLSKLTGLFLIAVWGSTLFLVTLQQKEWRFFLKRFLAIIAIFLATTGWWFLRNLSVYGEPLALDRTIAVWGARPDELRTAAIFFQEALYSWTNYWGRLGYGQLVLPSWLYAFYALITIVGLSGMIHLLWNQRRSIQGWPRSLQLRQQHFLVLTAAVLIYGAALAYYSYQNATGSNARYTFPVLFAGTALLVLGWQQWLRRFHFALPLTILLLASATYAIGYLTPWSFARPALVTLAEAQAQVNPSKRATWDAGIELLGTAFVPIYHNDERGLEVEATFCWQTQQPLANNYVFFAHLLDSSFNPLGQRDSHPGQGNYPTSLWQPYQPFCDQLTLPVIDNMVNEPLVANIEIGFYDPATKERLVASFEGLKLDLLLVDRIRLAPPQRPPQPGPEELLEADFAQGVRLEGYSWSATTIQPGEPVAITLWWESSGPLDGDYQVFVHLLDNAGNLIAQGDGPPQGGNYPTMLWIADETILDTHNLTVPVDAMPLSEETTLLVGFYRLQDGARLPRQPEAELADAVAIPGPLLQLQPAGE
ncbi:MAG: hypothetical protein KDE04_05130 [Anaerolineales bacterium]|nr:hypothetical protein [Anaerolineales bacterium]